MIAYLLDESIRIPGTQRRIGIDPILGFIPGVGDALGAAFGFVVLYDAARCRVSRFTQFRIAMNVLVNAVFGAIPILGDIFSATFKSNARNYRLLASDLSEKQGGFSDKEIAGMGVPWFAIGLIASVLLTILLLIAGVLWLVGKAVAWL